MAADVEQIRSRVDHALRHEVERLHVPGVSMALLVGGQRFTWVSGVLNTRTGRAVTPDSLFPIQSVTKVWTATLVMQLVDDGLLDLDAPVRSYLPDFHTADPASSAEITARHLLTHTGGFDGDIWAPTTAGPDALQRFVGDHVTAAAQFARPGEFFSYCSAGFGVLGHLVERLRGMPFEATFRTFLSQPLGIDEVAFNADEALGYDTAIGHLPDPSGTGQRPLLTWAPLPLSNPAAGNQLAMSAPAMLAFAAMHLADGLSADGVRVLSATSARAMRDWQVDHPGIAGAGDSHGLGWVLSRRPGFVEHGGGSFGIESLLQLVPEQGVAVALLTNGQGGIGPLSARVVDPLLEVLAGIPPAGTQPEAPVSLPATRLDPTPYLGRYETRAAANEVSVDQDGRLWLVVTDRPEAAAVAALAGAPVGAARCELRHIGGETFAVIDGAGSCGYAVQFTGRVAAGGARFLRTCHAAGRAALRVE